MFILITSREMKTVNNMNKTCKNICLHIMEGLEELWLTKEIANKIRVWEKALWRGLTQDETIKIYLSSIKLLSNRKLDEDSS